MTDKNWIERPFFPLFYDAIELALISNGLSENVENGDSIARSSILNATFSLEAAANCFLESFEVSKHLFKEFDKFGVLEKYEFLLYIKFKEANLDRGRIEIQKIKELISLRNSYVHPKPIKSAPKYTHIGSTYKYSHKAPLTQFLKIPEDSNEWSSNHAKTVINAVADFLSLFLIDLCQLTPKESTQFLCDELLEDDQYKIMFSDGWSEKLAYVHDSWGTNINFIEPFYVFRKCT